MAPTSSLLDFFDRTYIINLPERCDRRVEMEQELKMLNPSFSPTQVTFFPAIKPTDPGEFPSIGAKGCFLSHYAVLKEAQRQNLDRVLILEDDLLFTQFLLENQTAVVKALMSQSWDLAYLGHVADIQPNSNALFQPYSEPLLLSHFLAFNRSVMDELVNFFEIVLERPAGHPDGGPMHVDGAYSTFRAQHPDIVTLIATPSLGFQRPSPSDISGYKWFESVPGFSHLVGTARQVKSWHRRRFAS